MDNSENKSAIKGFMLPIIAGLAILELITIAVFAVIGKFDLRVVWGALWGSAVMILYYFLLARAVTKPLPATLMTLKSAYKPHIRQECFC